ncbi:MAG TPA: hypothetical protein VEK73_19325 [Xanthobacteraceae bacterium]|nr:hypothetical protein [Xanthobacteraceae bacterium]
MSVRMIAAWRQMDNWFNSQAAITQQDMSANNSANSSFATAQADYYQNLASLSATAATKQLAAQGQSAGTALQTLANNSTSSNSGTGTSVDTLA